MVDASVRLLDRGRVVADAGFVLDGYTMGTAADPNPAHEMREFVVWNAVVDHPEGTFLWDTGSDPRAGEGYWPDPLYAAFEHVDADEHALSDDLAAAGYAVSDIDAVVMSHLHLDHAGGLSAFEGTDVPIYVHEEELKFAYYSAKTDQGSIAYLASDFDRDLNWNVVHRRRHTLAADFELLHLPGHTPGVLGARIDLPEETVLIAGDECYVDENYTEEIPLGPGLSWSDRDWYESLQTLKEIERRTDADVLYGHDKHRFESFCDGWNLSAGAE
ncbi:Metallo-beta-lactamase superfamily protein [Halopelagius inordinatus]|uniref:Metallo-beta-lactamase superfamily protein n=1 Tax=Halopelagius inordinatus TaxID=553467 RepID=A0A1I2PB89_9EURY|nr:N-acyl homoserine lactonase family protein [Halopelagius inordinatus]SFG12760.1 Metallo-beta-lactamase superfamily protein [Halopelagius inordinatus]